MEFYIFPVQLPIDRGRMIYSQETVEIQETLYVEGKVKDIYLRFGNNKFNTHLLENT